jgi:hypothetical protein
VPDFNNWLNTANATGINSRLGVCLARVRLTGRLERRSATAMIRGGRFLVKPPVSNQNPDRANRTYLNVHWTPARPATASCVKLEKSDWPQPTPASRAMRSPGMKQV